MEKLYALAAKIIQAMPDWKFLPKDKLAHIVVGAVGAVPFWLLGHDMLGLAVVTVAAFAKEAVDYYRNEQLVKQGKPKAHGVDFIDFIVTVLGAAAVVFSDEALTIVRSLFSVL